MRTILAIVAATILFSGTAFPRDELAVNQTHLILRPDDTGKWFVQDDADHSPHGMSTFVEQTSTSVRVFFDHQFKKAGTVQITSDDGFANFVSGHASLGLNTIEIQVYAGGLLIDPADVWKYVPRDRARSNGNFWVNAWMLD